MSRNPRPSSVRCRSIKAGPAYRRPPCVRASRRSPRARSLPRRRLAAAGCGGADNHRPGPHDRRSRATSPRPPSSSASRPSRPRTRRAWAAPTRRRRRRRRRRPSSPDRGRDPARRGDPRRRHDWRAASPPRCSFANPLRAPMLLTRGTASFPPPPRPRSRRWRRRVARPPAARRSSASATSPSPPASRPPTRAATTRSRSPRAIDPFLAAARGKPRDRVIVVSADGAVRDARRGLGGQVAATRCCSSRTATRVPPETRAALTGPPASPKIYVLGPPAVGLRSGRDRAAQARQGDAHPGPRPGRQRDRLRPLSATARSAGASSTPATASCSPTPTARSTRPPPRRCRRPAPTARCCSSTTPTSCRRAAASDYLLDIQPGYAKDPVRGVYNHGWIDRRRRARFRSPRRRGSTPAEIVPVSTRRSRRPRNCTQAERP